MIRNTILVSLTIATLLLPPFAGAAGTPFTASGGGSNTATVCRADLVLGEGGCASLEADAGLSGDLVACVPEDTQLDSFSCDVDWTLIVSGTGASVGCVEGDTSIAPLYLLGCKELPVDPYQGTQGPSRVTYTHVPFGQSEHDEWVRACVDAGAPELQRCSDPVVVRYIITIQGSESAFRLQDEVDQVVGIVQNIVDNPPTLPPTGI